MPSLPRNAATVILLRDHMHGSFEIFLVKRHKNSAFMGNNYVYPGGVVDKEDSNPEILQFCKGISEDASKKALIPFMVTGIRELFEEAGMLLAYNSGGEPFAFRDVETIERFNHYRVLLQKKAITMVKIAQNEHLFYAIDRLYHFAYWITPEARPLRYNTHFFLANSPEGQVASADEKETTDGIWITPYVALEENLKRHIVLSPPTLKTLEDLARFRSKEEAINFSETCEKKPILSLLLNISGEECLIFPWDPDYESYMSGKSPPLVYHGRVSTPVDSSTRVLSRDGYHVPYCKE